jgi:hypothetical protein
VKTVRPSTGISMETGIFGRIGKMNQIHSIIKNLNQTPPFPL